MRRSDIVAAIEDVKSALRRLEGMLDDFREPMMSETPVYKKENGRLTDLGIRELNRMIAANKSDAEIAAALGITQAAVNHRRN